MQMKLVFSASEASRNGDAFLGLANEANRQEGPKLSLNAPRRSKTLWNSTPFLIASLFFPFCWPSWSPLGSILARFGEVLSFILEVVWIRVVSILFVFRLLCIATAPSNTQVKVVCPSWSYLGKVFCKSLRSHSAWRQPEAFPPGL